MPLSVPAGPATSPNAVLIARPAPARRYSRPRPASKPRTPATASTTQPPRTSSPAPRSAIDRPWRPMMRTSSRRRSTRRTQGRCNPYQEVAEQIRAIMQKNARLHSPPRHRASRFCFGDRTELPGRTVLAANEQAPSGPRRCAWSPKQAREPRRRDDESDRTEQGGSTARHRVPWRQRRCSFLPKTVPAGRAIRARWLRAARH
jgi:hypothetical protein